jgi:hypothetical protein
MSELPEPANPPGNNLITPVGKQYSALQLLVYLTMLYKLTCMKEEDEYIWRTGCFSEYHFLFPEINLCLHRFKDIVFLKI